MMEIATALRKPAGLNGVSPNAAVSPASRLMLRSKRLNLSREPLPFSVTNETRELGRLKSISPRFMRVSRALEPLASDTGMAWLLLAIGVQMAARREPEATGEPPFARRTPPVCDPIANCADAG